MWLTIVACSSALVAYNCTRNDKARLKFFAWRRRAFSLRRFARPQRLASNPPHPRAHAAASCDPLPTPARERALTLPLAVEHATNEASASQHAAHQRPNRAVTRTHRPPSGRDRTEFPEWTYSMAPRVVTRTDVDRSAQRLEQRSHNPRQARPGPCVPRGGQCLQHGAPARLMQPGCYEDGRDRPATGVTRAVRPSRRAMPAAPDPGTTS